MFDRYIAYQARRQPQASAIATLKGDISFARFDGDIGRFAERFSELELGPDTLVVVRAGDPYLHWVILLALARLGVPTASAAAWTPEAAVLALRPHLLITDAAAPEAEAEPPYSRLHLPPAWIDETMARPAPEAAVARRPAEPHDVARVLLSSGTTGLPKRVPLTWAGVEGALARYALVLPQGMQRSMILIGPDSAAFVAALAVWSAGGTVVFGPANTGELAAALPRLAPRALAGAPVQLKALLAALPADALPQPKLSVVLFGAGTPSVLKREIALRLSPDVVNVYGATETGLVAVAHLSRLADEASVGFVGPWAEVEAVDEDDQPLPPGEVGALRIRTPDCVSGYLDDPSEENARMFRGGWFYPGDAGSADGAGLLRLYGRTDEVINVGGEKMVQEALESAALACEGVKDAAAFMAPGPDGGEWCWMALVRSGEVSAQAVRDALDRIAAPAVHLAWVAAIPRNARGKILRRTLREQVTTGGREPARPLASSDAPPPVRVRTPPA
jgi:2,3-dihydroxybenzoate-AMP ligase